MSKKKDDFDFDFDFDFDNTDKVSPNAPAELTDEIRALRQRNKEFAATNEHETYIILSFSCKDDKIKFTESIGIDEHTIIDGYAFAKKFNVEPQKPTFALHPPMTGGK